MTEFVNDGVELVEEVSETEWVNDDIDSLSPEELHARGLAGTAEGYGADIVHDIAVAQLHGKLPDGVSREFLIDGGVSYHWGDVTLTVYPNTYDWAATCGDGQTLSPNVNDLRVLCTYWTRYPLRQTLQVKVTESGREFYAANPLPARATPGSAGVDLHAMLTEPLTLTPGADALIPTGLKINIANPAFCGVILPRSGLGHKHGVVLGNGTGLIDSDYEGELLVSVTNRKNADNYTINPGDRIAQYVVMPVVFTDYELLDDDTPFKGQSVRKDGGFGSSGINTGTISESDIVRE